MGLSMERDEAAERPVLAPAFGPDLNWVTQSLAIGGRLTDTAVDWLIARYRIDCVVDLRAESCDNTRLLLERGIAFLHLPTLDHHAMTCEVLWTGVRWVCDGLSRGHRTLIHCEHGIGRSALLTCCVLVAMGHDPVTALTMTKQARRRVSPSPAQLHALLEFSAQVYGNKGQAMPEVTWYDLASVAYEKAVTGNGGSGESAA
jgi:hypothetical protein